MGLGGVGALALKALGVSMMALMLASIVGLKKLTEGGGDGGHSVHYVCIFDLISCSRCFLIKKSLFLFIISMRAHIYTHTHAHIYTNTCEKKLLFHSKLINASALTFFHPICQHRQIKSVHSAQTHIHTLIEIDKKK